MRAPRPDRLPDHRGSPFIEVTSAGMVLNFASLWFVDAAGIKKLAHTKTETKL